MIKTSILLMLFLLISCGTTQPIKQFGNDFSPELQDDVFEFLADCQRHLHTHKCNQLILLTVKVQKLPEPDQLGVCYTYYSPNEHVRNIYIDPSIVGTAQQKLVVYHELAHCIFEMDHYDTKVDIMNSYTYEQKALWIYDNWDFFLKAMFSRIP